MLKAKKVRTSLYCLFLILWWLWLMHQSSNSRHEYCIKVLVNLNLQPRRHIDTYYSYFHKPDESNSLNDSFFMSKIEKNIRYFFSNLTFIFNSTCYCNYKQIRWCSAFLELKVPGGIQNGMVLTTSKFVDSIPLTHFSGPQVPQKSDDGTQVTHF